jgi:hypothetical protein
MEKSQPLQPEGLGKIVWGMIFSALTLGFVFLLQTQSIPPPEVDDVLAEGLALYQFTEHANPQFVIYADGSGEVNTVSDPESFLRHLEFSFKSFEEGIAKLQQEIRRHTTR